MNGLFSEILKKCAIWFLYAFIQPDAPLNKSIMKKRSNQIAWLKRLDAINGTYTYNQLLQIVYDGIVDRYDKTPAEMLTLLYNIGAGVTGIGALIDDETAKGVEKLNALVVPTKSVETGSKEDKNFWVGLSEVLKYIKEILTVLGIGKESDIEPTAKDWYTPNAGNTTNAGITDALPWVLGATALYMLFTGAINSTNKNKSKQS